MLMQSREAAAGGKSFEETLGEVAQDILERLPANFDIEAVEERCPQDYFNSMNTVLVQVRGHVSSLVYLSWSGDLYGATLLRNCVSASSVKRGTIV